MLQPQKHLSYFLLFASLLFLMPNTASSQWARGTGHGYVQAGGWHSLSSSWFDSGSLLKPAGQTYSDNALAAYAEIGLTKKLSATARLFGKWVNTAAPSVNQQNAGLGDLEIGVKYNLLKKGTFVLTPFLGVKIPTFYDETGQLPLGTGQFDLITQVQAGYSLLKTPIYFTVSTGYIFRGGASDDVTADFLAGWHINDLIMVRLTALGVKSFSEDGGLNFLGIEQDYFRAGGGVSVKFSPIWQLHLDYQQTLTGRLTAQLSSFNIGISRTW